MTPFYLFARIVWAVSIVGFWAAGLFLGFPLTPSRSSRRTATPEAELQLLLQTLQEESDVEALLKGQSLQTQLDKVVAGLCDVQAENECLISENRSQQGYLKTALDERDKSLIKINNQLRIATSSLALLNEEKVEMARQGRQI